MGVLYIKKIRSYVLILLAVISLIIAGPVRSKLNLMAKTRLSELTALIHEKTGLSVTYKSLSPSILSNLYIRGIDVFDDSGRSVLSIDRARINYRLFKLIKGDFNAGISNVIVDGIVLDLDRIIPLARRLTKSTAALNLDFVRIRQSIPASISMRNITLEYEHDLLSVRIALKNFSVSNSASKRLLSVQMSAAASASVARLAQTISFRADVTGNITESLDDSQLNFRISDLTNGEVRLNRLTLHATYNDNVIGVRTVQSVNPVSVGADINLGSGDISAQVKADGLNPVLLMSAASRPKELRRLKDFLVTTDSTVNFNYLDSTASYKSDTTLILPPQIIPDGAELSFALHGDEERVDLTRFRLSGRRYSASAELSYIFAGMRLSGFFDLPYALLANGSTVSTEVYFDPLSRGFKAFSPQIFLGDRALTALEFSFLPQTDSYDFALDVFDYSHSDDGMPGQVHIDGSYLSRSNYVQANVSLNSIYLDSMALAAAQLLDDGTAARIRGFEANLSPYLFTGDVYISTDFKSLSYNVPYVLLANTKRDNQALLFALNGTEQNIQLNQFSLVLGSYALEATASVDRNPDSSDYFFDMNLTSGSIPYHLSGSLMQDIITVSGDYGFDFLLRVNQDKSLDGHLMMENLPAALFGRSFVFTSDMDFSYDDESGPSLRVVRFEAEEAGAIFSVSPRLVVSGNATKYGAQIDSISYTDFYSALEGTADLMLNMNGDVFDSLGVMMNVKNPLSDEGIILDGTISNPDHLALDMESLRNHIYINMQLQMNAFSLNRFVTQQHENNIITGSLFASGTLEHPYVALSIQSASIFVTTELLRLNGNITLEERDITVSDLNLDYASFSLDSVNGSASLENMSLNAGGEMVFTLMDYYVRLPVTLEIGNSIIPENGFFPDAFSARLVSHDITGNLFKKKFPIELSVLYADRRFSIFSSDNIGLSGSYSLDGILEMNLDNRSFAQAKMDGFVQKDTANIELYDVMIDMRRLNDYLALDNLIIFDKGTFSGTAIVTGSFSDPDLNGFFMFDAPEIRLPSVTQQRLSARSLVMNIENNEIDIPATIIRTRKGHQVEIDFAIFLNKWSFEHLEGSVRTPKKEFFPVSLVTPFARVEGDISTDLHLYYEQPNLEVTGNVFGENMTISSGLSSVSSIAFGPQQSAESEGTGLLITTDLELVLGTHASVNFDPILRCVFVPNTSMRIRINQYADEYIVDGNLLLKSGDIAYLNRSFYIKSGNIKFNPSDISDPQITINAETRERDERGQTVKIVMDVDNQYLSELSPRFSSVPAKSENEIRALLGQIAVADSTSATNFLFAASDYAIQSTVVRQFENKLRDLLKFDIFSLRTNVLQNTLNMGVSGTLGTENVSIGNFLDNSTVYIGKYLANSLYVDAMLHVSFEDGYANDINSAGALLFQPEFGMELESPFANIRVNLAPDINALLQNQFVPSPSLTLSWKFAF